MEHRAINAVLQLEGRIPAPPPVFVGRESERRRLAVLLGRHRSLTVTGPGGIGKTSLALVVLHHAYAPSIDRVRWVAMRPDTGLERALSAAFGAPESEHALSLAALFLQAESQRWVVVIDDAHCIDPDDRRALYATVERYALHSQWLLLSRTAPEPSPDRAVLALDALTVPELDELAHEINPERTASERARLATAAAGSPLRLKLLASGALELEASRTIEPETDNPALARLRWLSEPVAPALLAVLIEQSEMHVRSLAQRSLLEHSSKGVRLHDEARSLLGPPPRLGPAALGAFATALLSNESPALWLEALRVLAAHDDEPALLDALDLRAAALLSVGLGRPLVAMLEPLGHPRARRWLLRALTQHPQASSLERIAEPDAADVEARRDYATALFRVGAMHECARVCEQSLEHCNAERRFDLALLRASTEAVLGNLLHAIALAERLEPVTPRQQFAKDSYLSRGYALVGQPERAAALIDRWCDGRELPAVESATSLQLTYAAGMLGRVRDARALLKRIERSQSYDRWSLQLGWLHIELESARLDRAVSVSEQLQLEWAASGYLAPMLEFVAICVAIEQGAWDGVTSRLTELARALSASEDRQTLALCDALADELATAGLGGVARIERPPINAGALFNRWRRALLREGVEAPAPFATAEVSPADLRTTVLALAGEAQVLALDGAHDRAARAMDEASVVAQRAGLVRMQFSVDRSAALLAASAGDLARLARYRESFVGYAAEMPSRRAGAWARWCALVSATDAPSPAQWIELARADAELAVLVHGLLGARVELDRWQRMVIDGVAARWPAVRYRVQPAVSAIGPEAWVLDEPRASVTLFDRAEIDLSRAEQTLSMLALLAHRGSASKKTLAAEVWRVRDYHRLRDDKRIEVAIRKLRVKIEQDPSLPRRVRTDRDGYALSEEAPLVALLHRATALDGAA